MVRQRSLTLMNDGFRRFLALLFVFALAFAVVFVFRRVQGGEGLLDIFGLGKSNNSIEFKPERFTLRQDAPLAIDDVEVLRRLDNEYARLSRAVVPSVVSIDTVGVKRERLRNLFGQEWERRYPVNGIGSGVIVTEEGHVITNHHVIADKTKIRVTLNDGQSYPARLIGEDRGLDIAVIRIEADRDFVPLSFGDSHRVQTGQLVFAIGNPFGLGETITQGIISAKERSISDTQRDLFQTDAAINPGNSGGPLVNLLGEIIGINVAIYSPDTRNRGFHGVGFSIPANDVQETFLQIVERGRPIRGYLGVEAWPMTQRWSEATGYRNKKGAVVARVTPGGPASAAGLEAYDVILGYDGIDVESRAHLFSMIQRTKVGKRVELTVWRNGQTRRLAATIIDAEEAENDLREDPEGRSPSDQEVASRIGIRVGALSQMELMRGYRGVVVRGVIAGSLAEERGIRRGDIITMVNNVSVSSTGDFYARLIASAGGGQPTTVGVLRGIEQWLVAFPPVERRNGDGE
ncbi:MAG: PDZ domain-containing protein [Akkermansiaceae bacterium]|nr:PDZ domain-containing protein [Akkermansiaceae bacterium]NNM30766.1 PDZ domain-containing protein [Akkermansiaceae bacterium]